MVIWAGIRSHFGVLFTLKVGLYGTGEIIVTFGRFIVTFHMVIVTFLSVIVTFLKVIVTFRKSKYIFQ